MSDQVVTPSMFYKYAACPHWLWYDNFGDPSRKGDVPELAKKLLEQGVAHEENYIKDLQLQPVLTKDPSYAAVQTLELMRAGVPLIYQGLIEADIGGIIWRGRPDLLEKVPGKSDFGNWRYVPCDIKSSHSIHEEQAMQLAFYVLVLEKVQGVRPKEASIINVDHERVALELETKLFTKTRKTVKEIAEILAGEKPPLRLTSGCKRSPWFKECVRAAESANDIALLYGANPHALEELRAENIRTVQDAAKMQVHRMPKISYAPPAILERLKLQAKSLLEKRLIWRAKPQLRSTKLNLYFDIEGDPLLDVEYLFGFWITGDTERTYAKIGEVRDEGKDGYYLYFLAEKPDGQKKLWTDFLAWLEILPEDFTVYHFADYERARTLRLADRYGTSDAFKYFSSKLVDLFKVVKASVIFPLYFYSIKDIAKSPYIGYHWRHEKAGGAQSVFWYEEWLSANDRNILNDIINYNEDDVVATEVLEGWLRRESAKERKE